MDSLLLCPQCRADNRENARYCKQCGYPVLPLVRLQVGFCSHPGRERDHNEDSLLAFNLNGQFDNQTLPLTLGLFAVADGIGGHARGEVASQEAVRGLGAMLLNRLSRLVRMSRPVSSAWLAKILTDTVARLNQHLWQQRQAQANNMGSTLTVALLFNERVFIANVGDSRTYLWRNNELRQLTKDHSLIASLIAAGTEPPEPIYTHPPKNVIYRSLGHKAKTEVDLYEIACLKDGDRLLLCSDGIWEMVREEGLYQIMNKESDPQQACHQLVSMANDAGGEDNISIIIVHITVE